jgi:nucleotide-binding universal stress UspA family protein
MKMKILVATDGSRGGNAAVRAACEFARSMRSAQLTVMTVGTLMRQLILGTGGVPFPLTGLPELQGLERRQASVILEAARRLLKKARVKGATRLVVPRDLSPVAETILREADRMKADVIVVGNEGRGAVRELTLGSVALRLLNLSRRPVLIIRPPRRRG